MEKARYLCEKVSVDETCPSSQIRPSDGGYGFALEERNRVPIIKSVEKGSPAEVRSAWLIGASYAPHRRRVLFLGAGLKDNGHQRDGANLFSVSGCIKLDAGTHKKNMFIRLGICSSVCFIASSELPESRLNC